MSEMKFRDELLMRLVAKYAPNPLEGMTAMKLLVSYADKVAIEACEQWGHDGFEFAAPAPGAKTIANPMVQHHHYRCRRCGRETK